MDKRRKVILAASILAGLLVVVLIIGTVYKYIAPSNKKRDLNTVFKLGKNEIALIADNKVLEQKGLMLDGQVYVPSEVASGYMDERIYVDAAEKLLCYAAKDGLIQAPADSASYTKGREKQEAKNVILRKQGKTWYVALSFIQEHASCYYKEFKNPGRLVIMSDRAAKYTFAVTAEDIRVRTGPNKKYDYLAEVPEGTRVFVRTDAKEENEYKPIMTLDGVSGYIPVDSIEKTEEAAWKFEKTPESFKQVGMDKTVCLGWHQVTNAVSSGSLPAGVTQAKGMNVISPTWFALSDNKGNFSSLGNTSYVTQAHAAGLQVWGLINDFHVSDSKKLDLQKILGRTSTRTKLVNALVAAAIQYDLDGINIDFENVKKKNVAAYLQFLRELVLKCHVNDLVVSVDNYTPANYNAYYNLQEQGRIVDYVILMAYDEHYNGSEESGSVSSLPFVKNGIKNTLAKVPKERVVTGLPFFTRLWKEKKSGKGKPEPTAYSMSGAESILRANDTEPKWDEATGQYFAQYKANGFIYKIWLEEETSLKKKLEVVKKSDVAGVAFWKLGFERAITWSTIEAALK